MKSISVAKEYRNLVMTRDMEGTSGKKEVRNRLKWTSSDPSVIKVDQKGKVTAVAYEGAAMIMAESEVYGVYSVILISATDVVKKIWLQTEAGAVNSSGESVGALYVMADLQHRTEKDFKSTMLPTSYYDAVDVTAKGDSLGFAYHAMSDASTGNTGVVVNYCANKVGNYEATVKLRDGNKAKGKFSFKIK